MRKEFSRQDPSAVKLSMRSLVHPDLELFQYARIVSLNLYPFQHEPNEADGNALDARKPSFAVRGIKVR
jgi:hypothetical protein